MTRSDFTPPAPPADHYAHEVLSTRTLTALLAGVPVTLAARAAQAPANPGRRPEAAIITSVHLDSTNAVLLSILGSDDRPRTVRLTAAEVMQIANHERLAKSSTDDGDSHLVMFN